MRLRKQRKALSIIDGQTGRSITEQHSPFPLLEVNRTTPQHEAINADHCAAQWLYTVSLTPPRCSQRSNTHCPSPAAEQSRPLLPNVQGLGQGSLGTTKLERTQVWERKWNSFARGPFASFNPQITNHTTPGLSFHFPTEGLWWCSPQVPTDERSPAVRERSVPHCVPPSTRPSPHSLNQHAGLTLAAASPWIWLGEAVNASLTQICLPDGSRVGANPNLKQQARKQLW